MKAGIVYYRIRQYLLSIMQRFIPWRTPHVISGMGSILKIPEQLKNDDINKVFIVTTAGFIKRGSLNMLFDRLKKEDIL